MNLRQWLRDSLKLSHRFVVRLATIIMGIGYIDAMVCVTVLNIQKYIFSIDKMHALQL